MNRTGEPHRSHAGTPGEVIGIALIGCGYVADFYLATLPNHPVLDIRGCYDRDATRANIFAKHHQLHRYSSLDEVLSDPDVGIVVNLTNPASHYDVSRKSLLAGKHVYSEKPLSETMAQATELVQIAEAAGLQLASAPCSQLGETAQTIWHALNSDAIGRPRLVYADLDDGAIHLMPYRSWISGSGAPWPYEDEFAVGPVVEHAAYYLNWLTSFFGPVREVSSFAALVVPEKLGRSPEQSLGPDFACACLRFSSGVVARFTCGTVAPENHSLQIVGESGVLSVSECWDYAAPVTLRRQTTQSTARHHYLSDPEIYPPVRPADYPHRYSDTHDMDFGRGVADLAEAVRGTGAHRLSARHSLHVLEVVLAINASVTQPGTFPIHTTFDPIEPAPWAVAEHARV